MTLHTLAAVFFLCLNMFFVLTEFSLVKAQLPRLEVMRAQGNLRASLVISMMKNLDTYLSAIQIGVTIGTLGLGWAAEPVMAGFIGGFLEWPDSLQPFAHSLTAGLSFCLVIYFQIVFAELVPRSIAIQKAEGIATWIAIPLQAYYHAFRFPISVMAKSSMFVSRLLGFAPVGEHKEAFSEDEVRVLLGMSQEKGLLPLDQLLLIENLFDLADLKVKDAMVPREKMVYLSTGKSWDENISILRTNHFSRYPLGRPDLDHPAGYIHVKDLSLQGAGIPDLAQLARPLATVEDLQALHPLLKTMASQGKHMMAVTHGGKTVGLITLEDVIEELLGEILDEFDAPNAWSFHNLLSAEAIDLHIISTTPKETIRVLAGRLKNVYPDLDVTQVEKLVLQREAQLPTAIGYGIALPHARLAGLSRPLVAIGRCENPLSFPAPDKKPVRLVFLVLTPTATPLDQLRILARIATLARNETLLKQMMRAKSPPQFLESIRTSEAILAG